MARKSKEFQKLFHEETKAEKLPKRGYGSKSLIRKKELEAYDQFKQSLLNDEDNKDIVFVDKPKGIKKMSEVLERFTDPYVDKNDSYKEREFLLQMAIIAWNCAVFPPDKRGEMLESFLESMGNPLDPQSIEATKELKVFIEELIERKLKLFDKDKRIIQNYQLAQHEFGFHLSVAYVMA